MKVLIITPGHPGPGNKSLPPALTAPYLAALISDETNDIKIIDLAVQRFSMGPQLPDLALLTTTMGQSDHIFDVANKLKSKGVSVILGGPHATLAYDFDDRIREVADCVILGAAEKALPQALRDFAAGRLLKTYRIPVNSLENIPFSRLDLLDHSKYYSVTAIFGTRNCPNRCKYCSIRHMYGNVYLKRPVDEIIEEIRFQTSRPNLKWLDTKLITFWDDNPSADLDWFNELMEKMIPLKKWWLSQMCLNIGKNKETLKLMKASGCKGIFVGLESVSMDSIRAQDKHSVNRVEDYIHLSKSILSGGINIIAATMYGFDQDTKKSLFEDTLNILGQMGVTLLQAHIVTPYPHSEYFKTLRAENRLVTTEAKYYNGYTVVHKPSNISPYDLQKGFVDIRKRFYSYNSIFKRMLQHNVSRRPDFLLWNYMYRKPNYEAIPDVDIDWWMEYLRTLNNY